MTSTNPTPSQVLRPGPSAAAWRPYWIAMLVLFPMLVVGGLLFELLSSHSNRLAPISILLLAITVVFATTVRIIRVSGLPGEKAEVRAGYTTLPRKYQQLDQLDPHTGAVMRRANEPFLGRETHTTDARWLVVILLLALLVVVMIAGQGSSISQVRWTWGAALVIVLAAFAVGFIRRRSLFRKAQALAPNDFVWWFSMWGAFGSQLSSLPTQMLRGQSPSGARAGSVSVTIQSLTIWQIATGAELAVVPWTSVVRVFRSSIQVRQSAYPTLIVEVSRPDGRPMQLTFMSANSRLGLARTSNAEVTRIVSTLDAIRPGQSSARII